MKNILYVGGLSSAERGAVGTHTAGIISGFQSNGIRVTGVFLEGNEPNVALDELETVRRTKLRGKIGAMIDRVRLARRAATLAGKYDEVYIRHDPFLSPLLAKYITVLEYNDHNLSAVEFVRKRGRYGVVGGYLRKTIYPFLLPALEKYCFSKATWVVCVTEDLCKLVNNTYPLARTIHLPNASKALYIDSLSPNRGEVVRLAHVGTLTYWDGLCELLDAVKRLLSIRPEAPLRLDIVGGGNMHDLIKKKIVDNALQEFVFLHAPMSHEESIKFLHQVDAVPLLKTMNDYGLSPIKFYEALCLGKFLICTDIRHISEIDADQGIVVPFPVSIESVVSALLYIIENIDIIRKGERGRAAAGQSAHSWHSRVKQLLGIINRAPIGKGDRV